MQLYGKGVGHVYLLPKTAVQMNVARNSPVDIFPSNKRTQSNRRNIFCVVHAGLCNENLLVSIQCLSLFTKHMTIYRLSIFVCYVTISGLVCNNMTRVSIVCLVEKLVGFCLTGELSQHLMAPGYRSYPLPDICCLTVIVHAHSPNG